MQKLSLFLSKSERSLYEEMKENPISKLRYLAIALAISEAIDTCNKERCLVISD